MTTVTPVEVTLEVAAAPAEVFGYWTDPVRYVRWMGAVATLDARPGGRYELAMSDGFRAAGRYETVDPPHQVTFTWGFADEEAAAHSKYQSEETAAAAASAMPAGSTRVAVTLAAAGEGTRLTLRHDNLPSAELAAAHQVAWETYLPRLAAVAAGRDPGPDPHTA
ncbi:MAG TPA: SRPBCC domain-containing protein [Trebonia sp.]